MYSSASLRSMPSDGREPERRLPVDDSEVDRLGVAAMLRRHHQRRHAENLGRGARVDILAVAERVHQHRIARHVRQQPQLDLRIIGDDQLPARPRHERRANFAAQLGADRDVLQIRIRGRQPPRGRAGLIERRVQAAAWLDRSAAAARPHRFPSASRAADIPELCARSRCSSASVFQHIRRGRNRPCPCRI